MRLPFSLPIWGALLCATLTAQEPPKRSLEELPEHIVLLAADIGMGLPQTSALNAILAPRGYPSLPDYSPILGGGASMSLYQFDQRFLAAIRFQGWEMRSSDPSWNTRLFGMSGKLDLGYLFVAGPDIVAYMSTGITSSSAEITIKPNEPEGRSAEEILDAPLGNPPPAVVAGRTSRISSGRRDQSVARRERRGRLALYAGAESGKGVRYPEIKVAVERKRDGGYRYKHPRILCDGFLRIYVAVPISHEG